MVETVAAVQKRIAHGVVPAVATPLEDDGQSVNIEALGLLLEFLIGAGVKGLFVGGTTGEGLLLDNEQRRCLFEAAIEVVAGRVPLLLHVGTNNTVNTVALTEHAVDLGADGIVAVTPTFYPMPDEALLDYYQAIGEAAPATPLFVYDIPHMAVNGIGPVLFSRLGEVLPTLAGVKTSRADAQLIRRLIDSAAPGVRVYVGNERIYLGTLALGAAGVISGLATAVPEPFVALLDAFRRGDLEVAQFMQRLINRILDLMPAGMRIGAIKTILRQRGIDVGSAIRPRPTPSELPLWQQISDLLAHASTPLA